MIEKRMQYVELIDRMSKEQIRDYWYELKQARYDSFYFRELYEKIREMNPNLVMPDPDRIRKIEKEAIALAFWEENWEAMNERRVEEGKRDYALFRGKNEDGEERSVSLKNSV